MKINFQNNKLHKNFKNTADLGLYLSPTLEFTENNEK